MDSVMNWQFESQFTNCSQANFKVFFKPCLYITNISIHNKKKVFNILIWSLYLLLLMQGSK